MVNSVLVPGGIHLKKGSTKEGNITLRVRLAKEDPTLSPITYDPADDGDFGRECGRPWSLRSMQRPWTLNKLRDKAVRPRPSFCDHHIKSVCQRQALSRAKHIFEQVREPHYWSFWGASEKQPRANASHASQHRGKCRRWMLDSGSSVHMLRTSDLNQTERECLGRVDNPIRLSTANGVVTADDGLDFTTPVLGIDDEAYVIDNAPENLGVLSMRRCIKVNKCKCYWDEDGCLFTTPDGRTFNVELADDVPIIKSLLVSAIAPKQVDEYIAKQKGDCTSEKTPLSERQDGTPVEMSPRALQKRSQRNQMIWKTKRSI